MTIKIKKRYRVRFVGGPYDGDVTLTMGRTKPPWLWGCKTAREQKGFPLGIYKATHTAANGLITMTYTEITPKGTPK